MTDEEPDELSVYVAKAKGGEWWNYDPARYIAAAWPLLVEAQLDIQWITNKALVGPHFVTPDEIPAAICRSWLAWKEAQG